MGIIADYKSFRACRRGAGLFCTLAHYIRFRITFPFWRMQLRFLSIASGVKGIMWCRHYHRPLLVSTDSYNGRDWTGRRRTGEMKRKQCIVCGNTWVVREDSRPLTWAQCVTGMNVFGDMWVGPKTPEEFAAYTSTAKNNEALRGGEMRT